MVSIQAVFTNFCVTWPNFPPPPPNNTYLLKMEYVGIVVALNANHDFSSFLLPELLTTVSRIFVVAVGSS